MNIKPVFLTSDFFIFLLVLVVLGFFFFSLQRPHWRKAWLKMLYQPLAIITGMILALYLFIALSDSIHFVNKISPTQYSVLNHSLLDHWFEPLSSETEVSYAKPWATHLMTPTWIKNSTGVYQACYEPLALHGLAHPWWHLLQIAMVIFLISAVFYLLLVFYCSKRWHLNFISVQKHIWKGQTAFPYRTFIFTTMGLIAICSLIWGFCFYYHLLGTDKIGNDVFYEAIKSIRTGLLIGGLTILFMLPFAISLGLSAGYFGGKVDDVIQYIYTTISSIPGILLIAAAVLAIQVFISTHPELFTTLGQQADLRLIALCLILGLTGWTGLCRVLRAETFKLREMDYVAAAKTMGVSWHRILIQHILPNVMHIIIVSIILDFSVLVLAEAVLTYVGVGVDASTISWGNMIDSARLELARQPVVWWPLTAAFSFMFIFVLALNLFGDALRNALDPRHQV